jgi:hypothetical protein
MNKLEFPLDDTATAQFFENTAELASNTLNKLIFGLLVVENRIFSPAHEYTKFAYKSCKALPTFAQTLIDLVNEIEPAMSMEEYGGWFEIMTDTWRICMEDPSFDGKLYATCLFTLNAAGFSNILKPDDIEVFDKAMDEFEPDYKLAAERLLELVYKVKQAYEETDETFKELLFFFTKEDFNAEIRALLLENAYESLLEKADSNTELIRYLNQCDKLWFLKMFLLRHVGLQSLYLNDEQVKDNFQKSTFFAVLKEAPAIKNFISVPAKNNKNDKNEKGEKN